MLHWLHDINKIQADENVNEQICGWTGSVHKCTGESEKKTEKKPFETEYVCVFKKMCEYLCENVLTREFEGWTVLMIGTVIMLWMREW